ncbi:uncharacterized protein BJ212DRAFT_1312607 [Suillus subaureus]|uniref:Secreted protein n=1 Tax=Suillus subaureus TaxID=48587 RepID=A0A9P7EP99_9AGAM|nr:uncharacterized protein BJ212DRAFT_1312607 [Suillus subaureus]KAG1827482.1 hypothetical protein BJ212DRAFT_1312607 [Suillus subaureus]
MLSIDLMCLVCASALLSYTHPSQHVEQGTNDDRRASYGNSLLSCACETILRQSRVPANTSSLLFSSPALMADSMKSVLSLLQNIQSQTSASRSQCCCLTIHVNYSTSSARPMSLLKPDVYVYVRT